MCVRPGGWVKGSSSLRKPCSHYPLGVFTIQPQRIVKNDFQQALVPEFVSLLVHTIMFMNMKCPNAYSQVLKVYLFYYYYICIESS